MALEGIFPKYIIQKADGSPVDPAAEYFVLRLDVDPMALHALMVYADLMCATNSALASDLYEKLTEEAKRIGKYQDWEHQDYTTYTRNRVLWAWVEPENVVDCPICERKGMSSRLELANGRHWRVVHGAFNLKTGAFLPTEICFVPRLPLPFKRT